MSKRWVACWLLSLMSWACVPGGGSGGGGRCEAGEAEGCDCGDGSRGLRTCDDDGRFSACACAAHDGGAGDGGGGAAGDGDVSDGAAFDGAGFDGAVVDGGPTDGGRGDAGPPVDGGPADMARADATPVPDGCVPDCAGRACGPDGCGGRCGECPDGVCGAGGQCVAEPCPEPCAPGSATCDDAGAYRSCVPDPERPGCYHQGRRVACGDGRACAAGACAGDCTRPEVVFVVDRSSSMAGARWAFTVDALATMAEARARRARLGVRVFPAEDDACGAGPITPPGFGRGAVFDALPAPAQAAQTPIAAALAGVEASFGDPDEGQAVVLLTDGDETCADEAAVVAAVEALRARDVRTFAVAIGAQANGALLGRIATAGGTARGGARAYYGAADAGELAAAIDAIFGVLDACVCDAGERRCAGARPEVCGPDGHGFVAAAACDAHASCAGDRCTCAPGYSGDGLRCADIDECRDGPCQHGGRCQNVPGSFTCDCAGTGYRGARCDVDADSCAGMPCGHGGRCIDRPGSFECDCAGTGYGGDLCDVDVDECEQTPCANEGRCVNEAGGFRCLCAGTGYEGPRCADDVDECAGAPCGAGRCINRPGFFECDCAGTGYRGPRCEVDVDECVAGEPCFRGVCENEPGSYRCDCAGTGYTGPICADDLDECRAGLDRCDPVEAVCDNDFNGYVCECEAFEKRLVGAADDLAAKPGVGAGDLDGDGDVDLVVRLVDALGWYDNDGRCGFGAFRPITRAPAGVVFDALHVADLDGDGDLDVAVVHDDEDAFQQALVIHPNDGRGGFGGGVEVARVGYFGVPRLTSGDLDGDGRRELLVAQEEDLVYWLHNDGGLDFGAPQALGEVVADRGRWVALPFFAAVDVDGDGDLDVAGSSGWRANRGGGVFAPLAQPIPGGGALAGVADFDGDGVPDLLGYGPSLAWYRGDGRGGFAAGVPVYPVRGLCAELRDGVGGALCDDVDVSYRRVQTYDADGDGRVDIVAHLSTRFPQDARPYVFRGVQGGFDRVRPGPSSWIDRRDDRRDTFALGDVDGDGHVELVEGPWEGRGQIWWWQSVRDCFIER